MITFPFKDSQAQSLMTPFLSLSIEPYMPKITRRNHGPSFRISPDDEGHWCDRGDDVIYCPGGSVSTAHDGDEPVGWFE